MAAMKRRRLAWSETSFTRNTSTTREAPAPRALFGIPIARDFRSSSCFADSAGNRSWRSAQGFDRQIVRGLSTRFRVDERSLWLTGGPKANVLWGTDEMRWQLTHSFALSGTGGVVRFADSSNTVLYRGQVEL